MIGHTEEVWANSNTEYFKHRALQEDGTSKSVFVKDCILIVFCSAYRPFEVLLQP
jgi:hypothetical protein